MGIFSGGNSDQATNAVDSLRAVDSALLHDALLAAVQRGWLVSFGAGRDGYAGSLSVLDGKSKDRLWYESTEELESGLRALLTAATNLDGDPEVKEPGKAQKRK